MPSVITTATAAWTRTRRTRSTKSRSGSDDAALRDEGTIRVTDMAFDEGVLLDQDRFLCAVLTRPEFQHKMTGTELRYRLGAYYAPQERRTACRRVCLSTCHRLAHPGLRRSARRTAAFS